MRTHTLVISLSLNQVELFHIAWKVFILSAFIVVFARNYCVNEYRKITPGKLKPKLIVSPTFRKSKPIATTDKVQPYSYSRTYAVHTHTHTIAKMITVDVTSRTMLNYIFSQLIIQHLLTHKKFKLKLKLKK